MKLNLKLSDDAPEQHVAILAVGGVMILISLISMFGGSSKGNVVEQQKRAYLESGETLHKNPQMKWYEKYLCRGYQRSLFCSSRFLHPLVEEYGLQVRDQPPKQEGVIRYRGPVPHGSLFSDKIVLDNYA